MHEILCKDDREIVTGDCGDKMDFYAYKKYQTHKRNRLLLFVAVVALMSIFSFKLHACDYCYMSATTANNLHKIYYDSGMANVEAVRRKIKRKYTENSNTYSLFLRQYLFFRAEVVKPNHRASAAIKLRNDCIVIVYHDDREFFEEIDTYLLKAIEDFGICEKYE